MVQIISLPSAGGRSVAAGARPSVSETQFPAGPCTILIIESDPIMRLSLGCMVADEHIGVVLADGSGTALHHLSLIRPDVIIWSVSSAENGWDLFPALRSSQRWGYVPIIALAGPGVIGRVERILGIHVVDVITKPVRPEDLRARLGVVLRVSHRCLRLAGGGGVSPEDPSPSGVLAFRNPGPGLSSDLDSRSG